MSNALIQQVQDEFYTLGVAADELSINPVTLWRWRREGKIICYRLGREVLVEKTTIERLKRERKAG